ncbi:MAG: acyclic terpene utilization AtuA family protein [Planctomycetaceae bacterium]
MKTIRIGNGAGFWGDNLDAPRLLAEAGRLDYLTLEYLAELTMSILAYQKSRNPQVGYVTDFPGVLRTVIPSLSSQARLKIVTNAGGMNPTGCAREASEVLASAGMRDLGVAAVGGDDLFPHLDRCMEAGESFSNFETGEPFATVRQKLVSANVYLGARGIVDALSEGARIVITGRVADASLTVGPAVHEHAWQWNDWQHLAQATVAGHLIECGAQATGGMYSDWTPEISIADVGYPIAEVEENGGVTITKPEGTGGAVTVGTVSEQLVYEIGDPAHYLTPDVDTDFTNVRLTQSSTNHVRVEGANGNPAPDRYKVSMAYHDGYTAAGTLVLSGRNAERNARHAADAILARLKRAGYTYARTNVECVGTGDSLPGIWPRSEHPWEVLVRISVHDPSREAVERFAGELAPLVTAGPPGVTGYANARPRPRPVLSFWPTTISRELVAPVTTVKSAKEWLT